MANCMIFIFILYSHPQKARAQVTRRQPRIVSGRESRMSSVDHDHDDDDDDLVLLRSEDPDPGILLHTPVSSRECPHWLQLIFQYDWFPRPFSVSLFPLSF